MDLSGLALLLDRNPIQGATRLEPLDLLGGQGVFYLEAVGAAVGMAQLKLDRLSRGQLRKN